MSWILIYYEQISMGLLNSTFKIFTLEINNTCILQFKSFEVRKYEQARANNIQEMDFN